MKEEGYYIKSSPYSTQQDTQEWVLGIPTDEFLPNHIEIENKSSEYKVYILKKEKQ